MAWCASSHLGWFDECRPLRLRRPAAPRIEAILAGEPPPPLIAPPVDPNWRIPDSIPRQWRQQLDEEPLDDW